MTFKKISTFFALSLGVVLSFNWVVASETNDWNSVASSETIPRPINSISKLLAPLNSSEVENSLEIFDMV